MTELLLDCLRPGDDRATASRLDALQPDEWQALLKIALALQVVGLLYQRVKTLGITAPPARDALRTLQIYYASNAARNLRIRNELQAIAAALQADHQPLLLLKGSHLAFCVYDDLGTRQMMDIDVLVPRDNLARVAQILEHHGYAAESPYYVADPSFFDGHHHLPSFVQQGRTMIELHWNITAPGHFYSIAPDALWQRAVPLRIGDRGVRGLCAEDLLLHACFHAAYQHAFTFGLRPFCDIAEIIRRQHESLSWPEVVARAQAWRWTRGVFLALALAHELVGASVPAQVLRELRPDSFSHDLLLAARAQVLTDPTADATLPPVVVAWKDAAWHRRIKLFLRTVFVPKAVLAHLYGTRANSPLLYVYYLVRMMELATRYGRTVFDVWRGSTTLTPQMRGKHLLHHWLEDKPR